MSVKFVAEYDDPVTAVPVAPIPAPLASTWISNELLVGCDHVICAVVDAGVVTTFETGAHAVITITLSTNQVSPLVAVVPVWLVIATNAR